MRYKVQPFIWQRIKKNKTIFQTKSTTIIVTSENLTNFLLDVEKERRTEIDESYLTKYFSEEEKEKVMNFLLTNRLLVLSEERNLDMENIVLLTNDKKFEKSFQYNLKDSCKTKTIDLEVFYEMTFYPKDVLIVFLNPFDLKTMNELTEEIKKKDLLVKFIFAYNNKIYFSNFYKKSWCNPCPMCFFYELESQLRGENSEDQISFQTMIDVLYEQKAQFSVHLPLDSIDYIHIICLLSKYFNKEIKSYYYDEVLELDLADYKVSEDTAYHWGYCDCYE